MRRAAFLDRDGVLNRVFVRGGVSHPPARVEELELLPGVREAVDRLRGAGLAVVVVTNQPDLARGRATEGGVAAIHARLRAELALDAIYLCPHDDAERCACRKPRPGLLQQAARELALDLSRSFLVGDRWSDVEAGRAAGCTTVLVEGPDAGRERCRPDHQAADLFAAADFIASRLRAEAEAAAEVRP